MKTPKMNFRERLQQSCEQLSPRQRKRVVLIMLLALLCLCFIALLQSVQRVSQGYGNPRQELLDDSLDHTMPADSLFNPFAD